MRAQTYSDNFTRPNSNTLGLSWIQREDPNCTGSLQILNNNPRTFLCGAFGYWNDVFPNDQTSKLQYSGTEDDGGHDVGGPAVRIDPNGTQTSATPYMAEYDHFNGIIRLWKYVNQSLTGPGTQLSTDVPATLSSGHWAIFSSYWDGLLGSSSDGWSCNATRTDTFIVELK